MTASLNNSLNGPLGFNIDGFVYPQFIGYALRSPSTQDIYNPGTRWQDNSQSPPVQWYTVGAGLWYELPNTSFGVSSVTGTANQITASPTVGAVVLSIPSTFVAPGSIRATTTVTGGTGVIATAGGVTATAGNLVATAGNLNLNGAASKININVATGSSASAGTGTLTSGVLSVTTSSATTNSIIQATYKVPEASAGTLSANCTVNGTLVITSSDATDSTSTVQWFLIN